MKQDDSMEESDLSKKLEAYKQNIEQRSDYKQLENIHKLFSDCREIIKKACQSVVDQLAPHQFGRIQGGYNVDFSKQMFINSEGIAHLYSGNLKFYPEFIGYINGSEIVVEASENGKTGELLRYPLNEAIDWPNFEDKIKSFYINGLTSQEE